MPEWIGKTIGKVRIEKYLAHGGMAEVYLGTHLTLDRPVAIKVLHSYIEEDRDLLERFNREAKVVAGLRHPNIVQIYDFDATDGHPYIVMEYLKGPSLAVYLRGLHERNERIPSRIVARLIKTQTAALDYAHAQGVIHRDIKPGNMLLHSESSEILLDQTLANDVEAILTDFGLVRIASSATRTASGLVSGTPAYMSPEQARGDPTDHRTDIYSLGIVLYEMLAGRVPFEGESTVPVMYKQIHEPPPRIPGISPAVQAVIDRALAKHPNDRYETSRDLAIDYFVAIGMTAEAQTILEIKSGVRKSLDDHDTAEEPKPPEVRDTADDYAPVEERKSSPAIAQSQPSVARKTGRGPIWIGAGIFAVICLLGLAIGAARLLPTLFSSPTQTEPPVLTESNPGTPPPTTVDVPDRANMVEIAPGEYEVGLEPADDYHIAPRSVTLAKFWIDRYQTTNAQYRPFLQETGALQPEIWPGEENHPVRGVTWDQAAAYCGWMKKRLPTEAEWEAAGRGPGIAPQSYPWGTDATAGGQALNLPDQNTYEVGTLSFNQSLFGVFDMVGNVWEWVGEPYSSLQQGYRILRGGRFGLPVLDLAYRLAVAPEDTRYIKYAGFRCAAD